MDFTLNGKPMSLPEEEGESLLALLRDRCEVTSAKDGCAPEGSCGACTVLVDGKAVVSCAQGASRAAGREVTTLEGLSPADRALWADSFVAAGASQCGFCSPGMVMKAEALLRRNPSPARSQVTSALAGNLCRCTGYVKIIDGVLLGRGGQAGGPAPRDRRQRPGGRPGRPLPGP